MASAITSFPGQQPPADAGQIAQPQTNNTPLAVSSTSVSNWHSSGSVGPFFGVITVLAVLAIVSCVLGRVCTGEGRKVAGAPPGTVKYRSYFRWMRLRGRWWKGGELEVGAKVVAVGDHQEKQAEVKANDGEVDQQQPQV